MSEKDRNKIFILLLQKLMKENDCESIKMLKTFVDKDTDAIKMSFKIMMENFDYGTEENN